MLTKAVLAGAVLASLAFPAFAANSDVDRSGIRHQGPWFVLQDADGTECYVANRAPGPDEARLSGAFASEQQAQAAASQLPQCEAVNIDPGKDSTQSNG